HPFVVGLPDAGGVRGRLVGIKAGGRYPLSKPDFLSNFLGPPQTKKGNLEMKAKGIHFHFVCGLGCGKIITHSPY
ncbi:MAG: hypothetical protein PHC51_07620, partial [bacterium]|nr:hypothetical protein [bacterium]